MSTCEYDNYLLQKGANPNFGNIIDLLITIAVKQGFVDIMSLLLEKHVHDNNGRVFTALHCYREHVLTVESILLCVYFQPVPILISKIFVAVSTGRSDPQILDMLFLMGQTLKNAFSVSNFC